MPTMKNRGDGLEDRDVTPLSTYIDTESKVGVGGTKDKMPKVSGVNLPEGTFAKETGILGKIKKLFESTEESKRKGMAIASTRPSKEM